MVEARSRRHGVRGFTLIELVVVILLTAIVAASIGVVVRPAMEAYWQTRLRAEMGDVADSALRRMLRDVRSAVPNSIRVPTSSSQCVELVPSRSGGRFRTGPDVTRDVSPCTPSGCALALSPGQVVDTFDVLSEAAVAPGDFLVIGNVDPSQVHGGTSRGVVQSVQPSPDASQGVSRVTLQSSPGLQVPAGYTRARFQVVSPAQQSVTYVCAGVGTDAQGNGTGRLYRLVRPFDAAFPAQCPVPEADAPWVADRLSACAFQHSAAFGSTQQNALVWLQLGIAREGETATLSSGAHVVNGS